jgi:hypothetical protein
MRKLEVEYKTDRPPSWNHICSLTIDEKIEQEYETNIQKQKQNEIINTNYFTSTPSLNTIIQHSNSNQFIFGNEQQSNKSFDSNHSKYSKNSSTKSLLNNSSSKKLLKNSSSSSLLGTFSFLPEIIRPDQISKYEQYEQIKRSNPEIIRNKNSTPCTPYVKLTVPGGKPIDSVLLSSPRQYESDQKEINHVTPGSFLSSILNTPAQRYSNIIQRQSQINNINLETTDRDNPIPIGTSNFRRPYSKRTESNSNSKKQLIPLTNDSTFSSRPTSGTMMSSKLNSSPSTIAIANDWVAQWVNDKFKDKQRKTSTNDLHSNVDSTPSVPQQQVIMNFKLRYKRNIKYTCLYVYCYVVYLY